MTVPEQTTFRPAPRRRGLRPRIVAAIVVSGVLFISFLPVADKQALHTEGRWHAGLHFVVFTVVGLVALRAAHSRAWRIAAFFAAVFFGFAIEAGEHLVFHGAMEWKDVLVDALGILAGSLLAWLLASRHRDPSSTRE